MVRPELRPYREGDIAALLVRARAADRDEAWAQTGMGLDRALPFSVERSRTCWTGLMDDQVACLFGVAPTAILTRSGAPWMVATDLLEKHPMVFLRRCRPFMPTVFAGYDYLSNMVDARNTLAIQWLKWLGFTLSEARPEGPFSLPFHPFEWRIH